MNLKISACLLAFVGAPPFAALCERWGTDDSDSRTAGAAAVMSDAIIEVRGISGAVKFRASGPRLRATPRQSREAPMLVRVADARQREDGETDYRVEFIGLVAGDYDLREYLERQDGSALNLAALPVQIHSQLAPDHGTDLFSSSAALTLNARRYRTMAVLLAIAWLSVPLIYVVVRALRRPPVVPTPIAAPPPSFADQLRPLVEGALHGSLSIAERGRLELLMYLYWTERLGWTGPQGEIVSRLRSESEAGNVLRAVERWLHAPRAASEHPDGEVVSLLAPYRYAPAINASGAESRLEGAT